MTNYIVSGGRSKENYFKVEIQDHSIARPTETKLDFSAKYLPPLRLASRNSALLWFRDNLSLILRIMRIAAACSLFAFAPWYWGVAALSILFVWGIYSTVRNALEVDGIRSNPRKLVDLNLENSLFTHILLEGTNLAFPPINNSQVFKFIHDFLQKEQQVSPRLLAQIKDTGDWLEVMEGAERNAECLINEKLSKIANAIKDRINNLQENESCIMPGGLHNKFALYRITRAADGYQFQIISRDGTLQSGEALTSLGKVRIGTTFAQLQANEVNDPNWIQALLSLQVQGGTQESLSALLEPFMDRKIDPSSPQNLGMHKPKAGLFGMSAVGTLWSFVQDAGGVTENKHRRKLRLQTTAAFRYAEHLSKMRKIPVIEKEFLKEGIKRLEQKMLVMLRKNLLTHLEHKQLTEEFARIKEMVRNDSPSVDQAFHYEEINKIDVCEDLVPAVRLPVRTLRTTQAVARPRREEQAAFQPNKEAVYNRPVANLPHFDNSEDVILSLERMIKDINDSDNPIDLQHRLVNIIYSMPLQATIGERETIYENGGYYGKVISDKWDLNPNDIWAKLSSEDRVKASKMLTSVAEGLIKNAKISNTVQPDRMLAAYKVATIVQHLAVLNSSVTKLEAGKYYYNLEQLPGWLANSQNIRMIRRATDRDHLMYDQMQKFDRFLNFQHNEYIRKNTKMDKEGKEIRPPTGWFLTEYNSQFKGDLRIPVSDQGNNLRTLFRLLKTIGFEEPKREADNWTDNPRARDASGAYRMATWGRAVNNSYLSAAAHEFNVEQSHNTQEAVVASHMTVLKEALSKWQEHLPPKLKKQLLANKTFEKLEPWEVRDLMLSMQPHNAIQNILGLIEQNPSILLQGDVCSLIEMVLFEAVRHRTFNALSDTEKEFPEQHERLDAGLKTFMRDFFDKHIAAYANRNQHSAALFLIHLSNNFRMERNEAIFNDYAGQLKQWIAEAHQTNSPLEPHRHAILGEYLYLFEQHEQLNHEQLSELVIYNFCYENSQLDPNTVDPVLMDRIRHNYVRWLPQIQIALSKDNTLKNYVLDRICQLQGKPLPVGDWNGEFPEYEADGLKIDLINPSIEYEEDEHGLSPLSPEILRDHLFRENFRKIYQSRPRAVKQYVEETETTVYTINNDVRVQQQQGQVSCYRRHPTCRDAWIQATVPDEKLLKALPSHLSEYHYYVSPDNPEEHFMLDGEGKPQYRLVFRNVTVNNKPTLTLDHIDDLRPGGETRQNKQMVKFDLRFHSHLERLVTFEHPDHIILWGRSGSLLRSGTIEQIELPRYGLRFRLEGDKFVAMDGDFMHGDFTGFTLNLNTFDNPSGMASGLLLEHPSRPAALLLPRMLGTLSPYMENTASLMSLMNEAQTLVETRSYGRLILKVLWKAFTTPDLKTLLPSMLPSFTFMHPESDESSSYWCLRSRNGVFEPQTPPNGTNKVALWTDMFLHASLSSIRPSCNSFAIARRAIREIGNLPPRLFEDDLVKHLVESLKKFPITTNESHALSLKLLLVLKEKGSHRVQSIIEDTISEKALPYLQSGKHINSSVTLTQHEITTCLHILQNKHPQLVAQFAPLILASEQTAKETPRTRVCSHFPAFFAERKPYEETDFKDCAKAITDAIKDKVEVERRTQELLKAQQGKNAIANPTPAAPVDPISQLFLTRSTHSILANFDLFYKTAKESNSSESFRKLRYTLKVIPSGGGDSSDKENSFSKIKKFLELLYDLRAEQVEMDLPDLPVLEYPMLTYLYGRDAENKRIRDDSDQKFKDFFENQLVPSVQRAIPARRPRPEEPHVRAHSQPGMAETVVGAIGGIFQRIASYFRVSPKQRSVLDPTRTRYDLMSIPELESVLPPHSKQEREKVEALQKDDCLFTEQQAAAFFASTENSHNPAAVLRLNELASNPEPVVKHFANKLSKELDEYQKNTQQQLRIKDQASVQSIRTQLRSKIDALTKEIEGKQEAIMKSVTLASSQDPSPTIAKAAQEAGYRHALTWDELRWSFLQGRLKECLDNAGLQHIDLEDLKNRMTEYLKVKTRVNYAHFCMDRLNDMVREDLLKTDAANSTASKLYELLSRCRSYDPDRNPDLLVVEEVLGFYMTQEQLNIVTSFVTDPNALRQAITGAGKTSVILLLSGLLKANGTNLVVLKFLESLYPENVDHIERVLGGVLRRRITPLRYNVNTPTVVTHKETVEGQKEPREARTSHFKIMYQKVLQTILERGCLVTDRLTQPLLEAKFISLRDTLDKLPLEAQDPMDREHLFWLAKLLDILEDRQHQLIDEYDEFLHPRKEIHLRLGGTEPVQKFLCDTTLKVYDELLTIPELALVNNTQEHLPKERLVGVLKQCAGQMAARIGKERAENLGKESAEKLAKNNIDFVEWLQRYFSGEKGSDISPKEMAERYGLSPAERDEIVLTKDLILTFLKIPLSRTAQAHYILAEDGVDVVPPIALNIPSKTAQFQEIRERIPYFIQYYYQNGVSWSYFQQWFKGLQRDAQEEIQQDSFLKAAQEKEAASKVAAAQESAAADHAKEKEDKAIKQKHAVMSVAQTNANLRFQRFFGDKVSLDKVVDLKELHEKSIKDKKITRKFLESLLPNLQVSHCKISIDAQNMISLAGTAGTSATLGCIDGLHPQVRDNPNNKNLSSALEAKMINRFLARLNTQEVIKYDAGQPQNIIPDILSEAEKKHAQSVGVVIDGAGALWGVTPQTAAEQIMKQRNLKGVGYHGDDDGRLHFEGNDKASRDQTGQFFSNAQSRGADVQGLSAVQKAVTILNGTMSTERALQIEGRLRNPDHGMSIAVPEQSGIKDVPDLINRTVESGALEYAENVNRSLPQGHNDILRRAALRGVVQQTLQSKDDPHLFSDSYKQLRSCLVSESKERWDNPGSYAEANWKIEREDANPVEVLNEHAVQTAKKAQELGLDDAAETLSKLSHESLKDVLPRGVRRKALSEQGSEVQVETQTEVQTQVTIETEQQTHDSMTVPEHFLPWVSEHSAKYQVDPNQIYKEFSYQKDLKARIGIRPNYDDGIDKLSFTCNFLPLQREAKYHRRAHDSRQNRLHYVLFSFTSERKLHAEKTDRLGFGRYVTVETQKEEKEAKVASEAIAGDLYDQSEIFRARRSSTIDTGQESHEERYTYTVIHDTKLRRDMVEQKAYYDYNRRNNSYYRVKQARDLSEYPEPIRKQIEEKKARLIAQMRFEDGQYTGYTDTEMKALEVWLREQKDLKGVEKYFSEDILGSRTSDAHPSNHTREGYTNSPLNRLFTRLINEKA